MKRARPWLLLVGVAGVVPAFAAGAVWQDRQPHASSDTRALAAPLHSYRALTLDLPALRRQLAAAPDERSGAVPALIDLPLPDGSLRRFEVWRTQVMAPALAARYPAIASYRARSLDGAPIEARLDDSPHGFSGLLRTADGVVMLQPVVLGQGADYVSFRREALGATAAGFRCQQQDAGAAPLRPLTSAPQSYAPQTTTGASVRNYRLALAATAEYTAQFGGTVADGMAAIVQAVNRVNGIYLNEFAVQFQLVSGNDQLVFTDPAHEPYNNFDGGMMLTQNQTELDSVIGAANYDLGHVFSTGGGGIANIGVTCDNSAKAKGVTGTGSPTGDAFWVDYVAHEMGHQLGAVHTFNDDTDGNCAGNRSPANAMEPGSASTIMGYAGICAGGNLQPHSDAYFHAVSLEAIAGRLAGGGATCGTPLVSGDQAPLVAPAPEYTIPMQTPFALTGSATDADNDSLTYAWEEMDLGLPSPPETDDGTRPLFRSYPPSASPTRLLPQLARILAHDPTIGVPSGGAISGETWVTHTRDLAFRLTVRDNHPGGAASVSTDTVVHVTAAAGPFRVTAPLGGANWIANGAQRVTWNVAATDTAPINCSAVDVVYSADGGQTFAAVLAHAAPNTGSATVIAPNLATANARVAVRCNGNIFFDISPGAFTVIADEIFKDGFDQ